jgi:signal transduction histidine kinase
MNLVCENDFETLGYPNEFSQVMMNLFSNAKDILKDKERNRNIEIVVNIDEDKKEGVISVIDNGGGISEEVQNRMFEPYFTTKHQSSGTGIGLYMSKEIIEKQMNGSIWSENVSYKFLEDDKVYAQCACINIIMLISEKKGKNYE